MPHLRPALPSEAEALTDLCLRAKAVWGYDEAFMTACRPELTLTPEKITAAPVQVAEEDGRILGMAQLSFPSNDMAELEALFVDPDVQRAGIGRALFDWATAACRARSVRKLVIDSDPGAAPFYVRMGANQTGEVASGSIPGRRIPRLEFDLG